MFENIVSLNIVNITHLGNIAPQFADPNPTFGTCNLASQFIPCINKGGNFFQITNNGDYHAQCVLAYSIDGHTPEGEAGIIGDPFPMDAGETLNLEVSMHFTTEYWTKTEDIVMRFYAGYLISETLMTITDNKIFNTQIYVENGNGVCEDITTQTECLAANCYWYDGYCHSIINCENIFIKDECEAQGCFWYNDSCHSTAQQLNCEDYATEPLCTAAKCHWYPYPNPIGDPSCHEQEMYMAYLPFIIAGVGSLIVIIAIASRR